MYSWPLTMANLNHWHCLSAVCVVSCEVYGTRDDSKALLGLYILCMFVFKQVTFMAGFSF